MQAGKDARVEMLRAQMKGGEHLFLMPTADTLKAYPSHT